MYTNPVHTKTFFGKGAVCGVIGTSRPLKVFPQGTNVQLTEHLGPGKNKCSVN
jgi:hypothetical protein